MANNSNRPQLNWRNVDTDGFPVSLKKSLEAIETAKAKFEAEFIALYEKHCEKIPAGSKLVFAYKRGLAIALTKSTVVGANAITFGKLGS